MKRIGPKLLTMTLAALMLISLMPVAFIENNPGSFEENISVDLMDSFNDPLGTDFNLTNEYQKIWEPNNIRNQ